MSRLINRTKSTRRAKRSRGTKLSSITLRGFGGGWNAVDDDISMKAKFAVELVNFHRSTSGAQTLRFGSRLFANVTTIVTGNILDMEYFSNRIVVVTTTGEIATIDNGGTVVAIWNSAIAGALPGAPTGWTSGLTSVDFVSYKGEMIIHNGIDKPITISELFVVTYLQDLATGSNVNVPIGHYGCVVANYHVVAGIPSAPTTIYISSKATAGVFEGDPAPNDGISLDVGAYAPEGANAIRGIAGFRNYLMVFFQNQALIMQLGVYDEAGIHRPETNDTLPWFGLLGHRTILPIENDIIFADFDGLNSAKRNLFSGLIDSSHLSELVTPPYAASTEAITDTQALEQAYAVEDRLHREQWVLMPSGRVFVRSASEKLRYESWSEFSFSNVWTCGCTSVLGRVYLAAGTKVFQYGNNIFDGEAYTADREGDYDETWTNSTAYTDGDLVLDNNTGQVYKCVVSHNSPASGTFEAARASINEDDWTIYEGLPIEFVMELPWLDGDEPLRTKYIKHMLVQSKGDALFTLEAYVDNLYKDRTGAVIHSPAVSIEFIGNDADGYGYDAEEYGLGRRSGDPRLWRTPVKFKLIKFRISGETRKALQLIALSFLYSRGSYVRG